MIQDNEDRTAGEMSLGRQQGRGARAQVCGFTSARSSVSTPRARRGETCVQRDAAGSEDVMLVRCGKLLFLVKGSKASAESEARKKMQEERLGKRRCDMVTQEVRFQAGAAKWLMRELDVDE